jgi:hypothetical protein
MTAIADPILDKVTATPDRRMNLVANMLDATLRNDSTGLTHLVNHAQPDDARWAAARLSNIVGIYLLNAYGPETAAEIVANLTEETSHGRA